MDNGVTAGLTLLNKMMDAEPNGQVETKNINIDTKVHNEDVHLTKRKHFRISQTNITEGDLSERDEKEDLSVIEHKVKKKNKWNCFGSCAGK